MRTADEKRFTDFAVAQAVPLRRQAYLLCGDWHTADDLVQTTLIKLYKAWPRVNSDAVPMNYARRTLVRSWLDERRRPWRKRENSGTGLPDVPAPGAEQTDRVADREQLFRALSVLAPRQRAVLVLRYFAGMSIAEVAEALDCSEGTVKSQAARALATLRTRYQVVLESERR
jgi:RNA polymerase sigma-70 factor (sigma-E family)